MIKKMTKYVAKKRIGTLSTTFVSKGKEFHGRLVKRGKNKGMIQVLVDGYHFIHIDPTYVKEVPVCHECDRTMLPSECGDEMPEERICDECAKGGG